MNSPVDQALLQLVHQNVHLLENDVKNWSEELKEDKEKVQEQLQIFDRAFKEIRQRLLRLETGHQRLESEQQRLETEQHILETGHQRLETEQHRLETEQQRLETAHQTLETEQQILQTGHQKIRTDLKRSNKDHEIMKTKQQRLESHSRDVEQRVIKCEGTLTFKKKIIIYENLGINVNVSNKVLLFLPLEPVTINNTNIEVVPSAKLLCVMISNDLKWNVHVEIICKKVAVRLYFLRQLKREKVPANDLLSFYTNLHTPSCRVCISSLSYRSTATSPRSVRTPAEASTTHNKH